MNIPAHWISQYQSKGALWIHDGNPRRPHALLTSGNHSSGFFNSELVMEDPYLLSEASLGIVELLNRYNVDLMNIDRVVGPAMGAITLAHEVALNITYMSAHLCLRAYVEKSERDGKKIMVFNRTKIHPGERILIAEDVLTTGGSVEITDTAITEVGGVSLPYVVVLVNRSGLTEVGGKKIIALINHHMPVWTPEECPLCKQGSEAIRPKGKENWDLLNAPY